MHVPVVGGGEDARFGGGRDFLQGPGGELDRFGNGVVDPEEVAVGDFLEVLELVVLIFSIVDGGVRAEVLNQLGNC